MYYLHNKSYIMLASEPLYKQYWNLDDNHFFVNKVQSKDLGLRTENCCVYSV